MAFKLEIKPSGRVITIEEGESILDAALRNGLPFPYGCRGGVCGSCKGKVLSGTVGYEDEPMALSKEDMDSGGALFCIAHAHSDIVVEMHEIEAAKDIVVKTMPCRVAKLERLADDVMRVYLKLPMVESMHFMAGQYIDILLAEGQRRSFSLANAPHQNELLELHIRRIEGGSFTNHVFTQMKEKDLLRIEGPLGAFYLREETQRPIIFMAGGTGFAPIKSIIEYAFEQGIDRTMYLYWGARNKASLYLRDLAETWDQSRQNFHFIPVLSEPMQEDKWLGRTGFVHDAIVADIGEFQDYEVYACGPPVMIDSGRKAFLGKGLGADNFHADAFLFSSQK